MDRVKFRIKTVLDKFRGWRHRVAPDRGRLVNELATYRHAFETTAADRDRLAVGQIEGQLAAQNLILGMVVFLVWQRDPTLETLPGRVLEWIGDYGRVAGLPRSLLEADDLESRIAEAILAYGDVAWRVDASRSNNSIVPLVGFALKDSSRGLGSYAIACYFRCGGEAGAPLERDWIARTIARGGYPQNPERAHIRGFLFQSLQKSGTVFTTRTLSSSLNIPNVVCTYHSPFNRIILDRASLQWPSIERLGIGTNWESLFFRLAPEIVALTSGGGGGGDIAQRPRFGARGEPGRYPRTGHRESGDPDARSPRRGLVAPALCR